MAMACLARSKHLIGFMMQVTECKYSVPMTCYVTGCSLCPRALFFTVLVTYLSLITHHTS